MRSVALAVAVAAALVAGSGGAYAGDKALRPYVGKLVISPDQPPSTLGELPAYLKINVAKDRHYEVLEGPPWRFHLVSWFAKPAKEVTVVIVEKADKKLTPMLSVGFTLSANKRLLYAQVDANASTGFEAGKTYVVRVLVGKKQITSSELLLRE